MAAFVPGTQVIFSKSMFTPFLSKPGCPGKFPKRASLLNWSLFPEQNIHHLLSHSALSHPTLNHHFITSLLHKTSFLLSKILTHGFTLPLPLSALSLTHNTDMAILRVHTEHSQGFSAPHINLCHVSSRVIFHFPKHHHSISSLWLPYQMLKLSG